MYTCFSATPIQYWLYSHRPSAAATAAITPAAAQLRPRNIARSASEKMPLSATMVRTAIASSSGTGEPFAITL